MTYKVFMENPYLKEMDSKIIKNEFKDNKSYIQLDKTIFYPHLAGGQPMDFGTINGVEILEVYEDGEEIIHVVKGELKTSRVHLAIDWDRRLDLMQQHTGQHLLSSSFDRLFNAETIGFHMGDEYLTIDVKKPYLTEDEASQIEYLANKVVQSNFRVKSYFVEHNQLSKLPLRKDTSIEDDNIRIVEIDNVDYSACCGTHVSTTGEIGLVKIRKWEKYKGNIRVEFICGTRALKDYAWKNTYIKEIGKLLSSKDTDVLDKVEHLYNGKETLEKENKYLREQIYNIKAELFLKESKEENGVNYIIKEFKDIDMKEINLISSNLSRSQVNLIQVYSISTNELGQFLICKSKDLEIDLKEIFENVSNRIIIKGGGNQQMIQGASSIAILGNVINTFKTEIKKHFKG
ncbi:MAG: hypothetical protein GX053_09310 [Tissierella sp.]|nr:hypothetical protein [Tissierella sp.]